MGGEEEVEKGEKKMKISSSPFTTFFSFLFSRTPGTIFPPHGFCACSSLLHEQLRLIEAAAAHRGLCASSTSDGGERERDV